jgi:hypothetical protein
MPETGRDCHALILSCSSRSHSDPIEDNVGIGGIVKADAIMTDPMGLPSGRYSSAALILCVNYGGVGNFSYHTQALAGLYEDNLVFIPM